MHEAIDKRKVNLEFDERLSSLRDREPFWSGSQDISCLRKHGSSSTRQCKQDAPIVQARQSSSASKNPAVQARVSRSSSKSSVVQAIRFNVNNPIQCRPMQASSMQAERSSASKTVQLKQDSPAQARISVASKMVQSCLLQSHPSLDVEAVCPSK